MKQHPTKKKILKKEIIELVNIVLELHKRGNRVVTIQDIGVFKSQLASNEYFTIDPAELEPDPKVLRRIRKRLDKKVLFAILVTDYYETFARLEAAGLDEKGNHQWTADDVSKSVPPGRCANGIYFPRTQDDPLLLMTINRDVSVANGSADALYDRIGMASSQGLISQQSVHRVASQSPRAHSLPPTNGKPPVLDLIGENG